MRFFDRLRERARAIESLLCVGLDPHISELPEPTAQAAERFCIHLIHETQEFAAMYKPNSAFFEAFGAEGIVALQNVIQSVPKDIPVLLDAKRGDIQSTAEAYAIASFDQLQAHAITLAPYMGLDSITPFLEKYEEKGCFVLCKTSNPSANDFQTLQIAENNGKSMALYEHVAVKCHSWNKDDNIGLVVGATDVEALKRVRALAPDIWILAPGIGAQGGDLESVLANGLTSDAFGLVIPISRGISRANDPKQAAKEFRDRINSLRHPICAAKRQRSQAFLKCALAYGVLKFGTFTLKSGRTSPYFFNAGLFYSGKALASIGQFYAQAIHESNVEFEVLFGPAYKGITLVAAVAMAFSELYDRDVPYSYNRKEAKDHGEGGVLVGSEMKGKRVLIIDDVITAGTAISEAVSILEKANACLVGVCIALDRQERVSAEETRSAVDVVRIKYDIPVISIASLEDLVTLIDSEQAHSIPCSDLERLQRYRTDFGV